MTRKGRGSDQAARGRAILIAQYKGARRVCADLESIPEPDRDAWWRGMWRYWGARRDELGAALGADEDGNLRIPTS